MKRRDINRTAVHQILRNGLWSLTALIVLSGCEAATQDTSKDGFSASSLTAYNYSTEGIQEFYVDGVWGSGVSLGGGGGSVCCVQIPSKWHEGLEVTVEWRRSDCGMPRSPSCSLENAGNWPKKVFKKTLPIEPYDQPGTTQVIFLPSDEIKVYVRNDAPWGPDHPSHLGGPRPLTADEANSLLQR